MTRQGGSSPRRFQRTDRVNELLREVIAGELKRLGEYKITVTGVETHPELLDATVYVAALDADDEERQAAMIRSLDAKRHRLQKAVANQIRAKRTPVLRFAPDHGVLSGRRVDELLRHHPPRADEVTVDPEAYRDGTLDT